jgi:hypothetical protein
VSFTLSTSGFSHQNSMHLRSLHSCQVPLLQSYPLFVPHTNHTALSENVLAQILCLAEGGGRKLVLTEWLFAMNWTRIFDLGRVENDLFWWLTQVFAFDITVIPRVQQWPPVYLRKQLCVSVGCIMYATGRIWPGGCGTCLNMDFSLVTFNSGPTRCTLYSLFLSLFSSTRFGCYLHPSSGAQLQRTAIGL